MTVANGCNDGAMARSVDGGAELPFPIRPHMPRHVCSYKLAPTTNDIRPFLSPETTPNEGITPLPQPHPPIQQTVWIS
jgi:hypothetical protein